VNWLVFAILGWLALGLDLGLRPGLALGESGIAPSFTVVLLAWVSLAAPRQHAMWAAMALGVALDLTALPAARGGSAGITSIGPNALGCMLGASLAVNMRAMLMHRNALSLGFVAAVVSLTAGVVVVACFALRSWYDPAVAARPSAELVARVGVAVYTGFAALLVAPALHALTPLMGFIGAHGRAQWTVRR